MMRYLVHATALLAIGMAGSANADCLAASIGDNGPNAQLRLQTCRELEARISALERAVQEMHNVSVEKPELQPLYAAIAELRRNQDERYKALSKLFDETIKQLHQEIVDGLAVNRIAESPTTSLPPIRTPCKSSPSSYGPC